MAFGLDQEPPEPSEAGSAASRRWAPPRPNDRWVPAPKAARPPSPPLPHHPASRYSPGTIIRDATSWITGKGRTPRPGPKGRVSVNPIARAATDAKMTSAQQLQEEEAAKEEEAKVRGAPAAACRLRCGF